MIYRWDTMGMPAKLWIAGAGEDTEAEGKIKALFMKIDQQFSTYKNDSEISRYNRGEIELKDYPELSMILTECERTKAETGGYFDSMYGDKQDPSGLVKGYAISQAGKLLTEMGYKNFLVEIAGDLQTAGVNDEKMPWQVGIENPFNRREIIKVVKLSGVGMATSGTAIHKDHIVNPLTRQPAHEIASISVIAPDVYDADRMATTAFAMGTKGIEFIEQLPGYAGYMVTNDRRGIMTESFKHYV